MTTYNSESKFEPSQSKIDELDKLINAYRVNSEDEIADGLEEIRPELKEVFDSLQEFHEEIKEEKEKYTKQRNEELRQWLSKNIENDE